MGVPQNILQNVQTYQKAELAWMLNEYVLIYLANKKFKNFNSLIANLGDTVTFDLSPRSSTQNGLVVSPQQSAQRVQSLICSQAVNTSAAYTDQQFIFNVEEYLDRFGRSRIAEIGTYVESDIAQQFISGVRVNDPQNPNFGNSLDPASGPYRFYGNGITPINSYGQLAQAMANFRDFGAAIVDTCAVLPMTYIPPIINSGLNQFVIDRNEEDAYSWMLGRFANCDWYESNLLPIHSAGSVGESQTQLTLVRTNDPTGNNVTQITFSGATPGDLNAIKNGDMAEFINGPLFRQFIGHKISSQPVQFRVTADSAADSSGNVTVDVFPALVSTPGINQNLSQALEPGMTVLFLPSHRAGIIMSGNPLYLAMPQLPDEDPYNTVRTTDPDSGCSLRHYWGSQLGQNVRLYIWDVIWGSTFVAENGMRIAFPL